MGPRLTACLLLLTLLAAPSGVGAAVLDLQPRLRVEVEYNDNVFLRSSNEYADYVITTYPGFNLAARSQTGGVELDYELGYSYYCSLNTDFVRHALGFRAYQALSPRLTLEAVDTFYRYEDLIEPGLGTLAPREALRPYSRNIAVPRLTYTYGPQREISLLYNNIVLANDEENIQDAMGNRVGFEMRHAIDRHNQFTLAGSFERGDFQQITHTTPGFLIVPDFNAERAAGGYTYDLSAHLSLLASYDFETFDFSKPTVPDYQTHEGKVGFLYRPAPGWSGRITAGYYQIAGPASVDTGGVAADILVQKEFETGVAATYYRRGVSEDFYSGENLGVFKYWLSGLSGTYFLQQHLSGVLEVSGGMRHFPLVARDDNFYTVAASLIYQMYKWLDVGARYERYFLESTPGPFNFSNNRYIATIGATY